MIRNELLTRYEKRNEDMTKEVSRLPLLSLSALGRSTGLELPRRKVVDLELCDLRKRMCFCVWAVGILQGVEH